LGQAGQRDRAVWAGWFWAWAGREGMGFHALRIP
jgi:hypothetical protein